MILWTDDKQPDELHEVVSTGINSNNVTLTKSLFQKVISFRQHEYLTPVSDRIILFHRHHNSPLRSLINMRSSTDLVHQLAHPQFFHFLETFVPSNWKIPEDQDTAMDDEHGQADKGQGGAGTSPGDMGGSQGDTGGGQGDTRGGQGEGSQKSGHGGPENVDIDMGRAQMMNDTGPSNTHETP